MQARLALARVPPIANATCLLALSGLCAWVWGVPQLQAQGLAQARTLVIAQQALRSPELAPVTAPSVVQQNLAAFYDVLGETHHAEQQIKTLFAIAEKAGLILNLADYKLANDKSGRFQTYQIVLPVQGTYSAIRQFCEQTLLTIPFASLDELSFKRDGIGNRTLEARIRLTLYLTDKHSADGNKEGMAALSAHR